MSTYRLERLFRPRSIALVGASPTVGSLGRELMRNLMLAGFPGPILPVNPKHTLIEGQPCFARLSELPEIPDVLVVASPPATVPDLTEEAGRLGVAAAIVITAGLGHGPGSPSERARLAARAHGLRLVGPNCFGVIAPGAHVNASFAARGAEAGNLALISQSGAVAASLLEWACGRGIGFTGVVSLGDMADVDFADCLDYFAAERSTHAILLYIEAISDARKFMSAARAAARTKPVVVIKAGRHAQSAVAAATHTGALAGADAVYDAAFHRAGLLRVFDLRQLFSAAETLGRKQPFIGKRLAIITNGGGIGVLAVDRLLDEGGTLAILSQDALSKLDAVLPPAWSRGNPVDIIGDADGQRYREALDIVLQDKANDAVLAMHVPTAVSSAKVAADAVVETVALHQKSESRKPIFSVWPGVGPEVGRAFDTAGIPHFETEADAVVGFMHHVRYREAQNALAETPESLSPSLVPYKEAARQAIDACQAAGRSWLDPVEVCSVLRAYGVPVLPSHLAPDADAAAEAARPYLAAGERVAVKILSRDITHKSDVGGVMLDLATDVQVRAGASEILARASTHRPDARIEGVTVSPMARVIAGRELIAGIADDPTFGPVIVFGSGGTAVEVVADKAIALPPLDSVLARDLIARTRVARILKAYRDIPTADEHALERVLVALARLAADFPEIRELDINPLLAGPDGVLALDARVRIGAFAPLAGRAGNLRFSIRPYPSEWERGIKTRTGAPYHIRPVRPEDEVLLRTLLERSSAADLRLRFFGRIDVFDHSFLAKLVQLDYARAIAFVAIEPADASAAGVVRFHSDADHERGEFAILVRSDQQGRGLGFELMNLMLEWAEADSIRVVYGQVLAKNNEMLRMCRLLGFYSEPDPDDPNVVIVSKTLEKT
jgi:acetyltransferase